MTRCVMMRGCVRFRCGQRWITTPSSTDGGVPTIQNVGTLRCTRETSCSDALRYQQYQAVSAPVLLARDVLSIGGMKQPAGKGKGNDMGTTWTWKDSPELMRRLADAQMTRDHQDIMTIAGCFTSAAELLRHVERYEAAQ